MDANQAAMTRCAILKGAVSEVLSATLQSEEADKFLKNAFPSYSFTDENGTTDSILASLTKIATDIALSRVEDMISQNSVKSTLEAIDAQFLCATIPQNDSMDIQTPTTFLPTATLRDVTVSCKKNELEKLKVIETERLKTISELREKVKTRVQEVGSLRGEITCFSRNAEEVFHMTTPVNE